MKVEKCIDCNTTENVKERFDPYTEIILNEDRLINICNSCIIKRHKDTNN